MKKQDIATIGKTVTLSRRDKLLRWAKLIRDYTGNPRHACLYIYNELEYWSPEALATPLPLLPYASAFTLAAHDPVFRSMGLDRHPSVMQIMSFFELKMNELHSFSCDCGGLLTNEQMAHRIERLAHGEITHTPTMSDLRHGVTHARADMRGFIREFVTYRRR
jgi:hypothetical protein